MWLDGKTVIITGASGGLGFAMAKLLIEKHGCTVIGVARNREKAEKAAAARSIFCLALFRFSCFSPCVRCCCSGRIGIFYR